MRSGQPPIRTALTVRIRSLPGTSTFFLLLLGAVFGLSTYSYRHIFSEGHQQVETAKGGSKLGSRVLWAMVCTFLWPTMVLMGLNSARILAKR
jgi:hypothetical protein